MRAISTISTFSTFENTPDPLDLRSRNFGLMGSLLVVSSLLLFFAFRLEGVRTHIEQQLPAQITMEYRVAMPESQAQAAEEAAPAPVPPPPVQQAEPQQEKVVPKPCPLAATSRKKKAPQAKPEPMEQAASVPAAPVASLSQESAQTGAGAGEASHTNATAEPSSYEQSTVDTIPSALRRGKPQYPARARRMNVTGKVDIRFLVNKEGRVEELQIIKATPENIFEEAVRQAVAAWRFQPGMKDGKIVATWMVTAINFEME